MELPAFEIAEVRKHYDRLSHFYQLLWGEHLHHGYWEKGESISQAQLQLMQQLAEAAGLSRGLTVLDIGCGVGGSALWLAANHHSFVTGLTISPVQIKIAQRKAKARGLAERVRFQLTDANMWQPEPESVDVVWIMESSEHFRDKKGFFARCASALKPGGTLAVCAWLRGQRPLSANDRSLVVKIGEAMFSASLDTLTDYTGWMNEAGLQVEVARDITNKISPTWDHCARMAARFPMKYLVNLADAPTRRFVQAFPLMQQGYATGAMAFGLFVARKRR